jgi:endonuclease YncB( thermonuclease family)
MPKSIFVLLPLLALWWPASPWRLPVRIERVVDGDTLDVGRGSSRWRVRLAGVDAPEKTQPLRLGGDAGALATLCLKAVLARGGPWRLHWLGRDRYGRVLGELHGRDGVLGDQLIEAGCTLPYRFVGDGPHRAAQRRRALERARRARRGMWGHGGIEDPYQWRRRQKTRRRPVAKE